MRKFFAILLLVVHVFNLAGYTLLFRFLQKQNNKFTLVQIENGDYADRDLLLIKLPMLLPYSTNWKDYERYDGAFELDGVHYNYVKRKLQNDTLYVLCLPNTTQTKLYQAQRQYATRMNDLPDQKKNTENTIKKASLTNEYDKGNPLLSCSIMPYLKEQHFKAFSSSLLKRYKDCIIQPPDTILG